MKILKTSSIKKEFNEEEQNSLDIKLTNKIKTSKNVEKKITQL